jgi:hypothetical protein
MNRECPDYYVEASSESSMADTRALIDHIHKLSSKHGYDPQRSLVHPILTPRFAISTTPDLLDSLGALAATDPALRIQTHIAENKGEIDRTHELFPDFASYAAVYDGSGLLRRGTVLAHAVHLTDDELALIARRNAGISHCPTSNFNLRSGLAPVGEMLDRGINVRGRALPENARLTLRIVRSGWGRTSRVASPRRSSRPCSTPACARRHGPFSTRPCGKTPASHASSSQWQRCCTLRHSAVRTSAHSRAASARLHPERRSTRSSRARGRSVGTRLCGALTSTTRSDLAHAG